MENNEASKIYFKNIICRNSSKDTKNKILYKFNIMDNNPKSQNHNGKCYLININFFTKNTFSLPKKKIKNKDDKLPLITLRENKTNFNTLSCSKSRKELDNQKHKFTEKNESKTIPISFNINHNKTYNKKKNNNKSTISLTEPFDHLSHENKKYNDIINKINERYFVKHSTIKYLNKLFFGNNRRNDLKVVNLCKIKEKDKEQNAINYNKNNNLKVNSIYEHKSYLNKKPLYKKFNSFNERMNDNTNEANKISKSSDLDKKIKSFQQLKIKKCKNLVDSALKDLMKARKKNSMFIENFRKSCDFKYEDF